MKQYLTTDQRECLNELCREYATTTVEEVVRLGGEYVERLLEYNRAVPLISRAGDQKARAVELFLSSLAVLEFLPRENGAAACDLGSGGGFPAIPLKIARPDMRWILIESRQRKCTVLESMARTLSLTGIDILCQRFEDYRPPDELQGITVITRAGPPADLVFNWARNLAELEHVVLFETPIDAPHTEKSAIRHGFYLSVRKEVDRRLNFDQLLLLQFKKNEQ